MTLKSKDKWDILQQTEVSPQLGIWEQVPRELFRAAVEDGKWSVVKQWADYSLYDDLRWWALQEAYKNKQWGVMLQLADHGLTQIELMWVRYRVAMYANWNMVLKMFTRGVDVTEVREMVENVMTSRKTKSNRKKHEALKLRWRQLFDLEKADEHNRDIYCTQLAVCTLLHPSSPSFSQLALASAACN
jgi:hypothetical protein